MITEPKTVTREDLLATYPNLVFTDGAKQRLDEVLAFLHELDARDHGLAEQARSEFHQRLAYLDGYGGPVSADDHRRRFTVTLGGDFAPLCFSVTWASLNPTTGEHAFCMNGGLIWHGGPADPFCVSLDPDVLWGVHT